VVFSKTGIVALSIAVIEEADKQLIGLVPLLPDVFFAIITVSDLKIKLAGQGNFWILFFSDVLPIGC
jgi:hypothetical protein